jgi:NDP-sugar pyrophosphorylase family protein
LTEPVRIMSGTVARETSVVLLAGGEGTRLRPLTAVFPKPLVPLGTKPVMEILLRRLAALGLTNITVCTGYLAELLMAVFQDGAGLGVRLTYQREEAPLGTAGPLAGIADLTDPCIVMNGDLLTTLDFGRMLDHHTEQNADITIGVYKRDVHIDFGVVESDSEGRFKGFNEKPTYHYEVSMGVNVLSRSVTRTLRKGEHLDMPDLITRVYASGGKVCCYREDCYWLDIGRLDDYALAQEQFAENERMFLGDAS